MPCVTGIVRGLKSKSGFSATEIFRKYLWYLLRERKFDEDAVADLAALRTALSMTDEEVTHSPYEFVTYQALTLPIQHQVQCKRSAQPFRLPMPFSHSLSEPACPGQSRLLQRFPDAGPSPRDQRGMRLEALSASVTVGVAGYRGIEA